MRRTSSLSIGDQDDAFEVKRAGQREDQQWDAAFLRARAPVGWPRERGAVRSLRHADQARTNGV
jgi:hypothetical protein